jgi:mono/diheme cytochrome c family protein
MRRWILRAAVIAIGVGVAGAAGALPWTLDMVDSAIVKAYRQPMRPLADGVVAQANILSPEAFTPQISWADAQAGKLQAPFPSSPEVVADGQKWYGVYCTPCHGDGVKLGPVADAGFPAVAVLAGPDGRLFRLSDAWVYATIRNGSISQLMPPYGYAMDEQEMWSIVHYMRTLDNGAYVPPAPVDAAGGTP